MNVLEKLLISGTAIGTGVFVENELVGYIIGKIKVDPLRGRHVWVPYEGMALRAGQSLELIRTLYAEVSAAWLKQDCFMHYAIVPLGNQAYFEAFQRLSFFIQQVHGVMNLKEYSPFAQVSSLPIWMLCTGRRAMTAMLCMMLLETLCLAKAYTFHTQINIGLRQYFLMDATSTILLICLVQNCKWHVMYYKCKNKYYLYSIIKIE